MRRAEAALKQLGVDLEEPPPGKDDAVSVEKES